MHSTPYSTMRDCRIKNPRNRVSIALYLPNLFGLLQHIVRNIDKTFKAAQLSNLHKDIKHINTHIYIFASSILFLSKTSVEIKNVNLRELYWTNIVKSFVCS